MGSDRARVSYDPKQQYRSVVMQQGRVTLEADFNEELAIAGEELREETLDIVGPNGTPDNGYLIAPLASPPFDFSISAGTMYVGGLRVTTPAPAPSRGPRAPILKYSQQQEWLDHTGDPDWVDISNGKISGSEFVYLQLYEREVSAVEDSDLKDVALGGPDTAQRTRLIQHIVRLADGDDCASGLAAAIARWAKQGLAFDPNTMRLLPEASLKVGFTSTGGPPDPCLPQAQGGYLGADNQLIRIQISGIDKASGKPKFVWGFDDASFLYRLDVDSKNKTTLHLQSRPVDAFHQPRAQQAVEVLRSASLLSNGEYVASATGVVLTLDAPYNPDTQRISLPAGVTSLPPEYYDSAQTPRVFLRVWEEEVVFTPGTATPPLGTTGLQVTLTSPSGIFHTGDYWLFAVRPSTPQQVYPERYLQNSQPADGPRLWACPLGVLGWNQQVGTLLADCRNPFDNLVELTKRKQGLGGCCTVSIRPGDITANNTLQSVVDKFVTPALILTAADPGSPGNDISFTVRNVVPGIDPAETQLRVEVADRHTYTGLTLSTIQPTLAAVTGLAHVAGPVTTGLAPKAGSLQMQGGTDNTKAVAQIPNVQGGIAFTLEAKKTGIAGNQITVEILNVDLVKQTFDLTVGYFAAVNSITLGQLGQNSNELIAYELGITPPSHGFAIPLAGRTRLSGGTDGSSPAKAKATVYAAVHGKLCLLPGTYALPRTLSLGVQHSGLTVEGCSGEVIVQAASGAEANFLQGLVLINSSANVTLEGLTFNLPAVPFVKAGGTLAGLDATTLNRLEYPQIENLIVSVGIRPVSCSGLVVDECTFHFQVPESGVFEAGILASGSNQDFVLSNSRFLHASREFVVTQNTFAIRIGYMATPSVTIAAPPNPTPGSVIGTLIGTPVLVQGGATSNVLPNSGGRAVAGSGTPAATPPPAPGVVILAAPAPELNGTVVESTLLNASFHDNQFEGLTAAALIYAATGALRVEDNTVRDSYSGFWVLSLKSIPFFDELKPVQALSLGLLADPVVFIGSALGRAYPLPADSQTVPNPVQNAPAPLPPPPSLTNDQLRRFYRLQFSLISLEKRLGISFTSGLRLIAAQNNIHAIQSVPLAAGPNSGLTGINVFIGFQDQSASGFVVWGHPEEKESEIVFSASTIHNNNTSYQSFVDRPRGLPTVAILAIPRSSITGNHIINGDPNKDDLGATSLVLDPVPFQGPAPLIAVTGNVLQRKAFYPDRVVIGSTLTPPFNSWDFLNTMVP